jgi:PST family polysaccharide transporter
VPEAAPYFPGLALAGLVLQASQVPSATLVRSLRFRIVATSRALGELAFTATSVALAPLLGAMAIVAGNIARSTLVSGLLLLRSDAAEWFEPTRPRAPTLGRFLAFGLPLTGVILTDAAASQWDNLLVGRLFGPAAVGQYALAYNLATTPASAIAEPISDVLFPSFAKIPPDRRKDAFRRAVALLALVSFPVVFGLAAIAARLVGAILHPQWAPVGTMMALLTGVSLMRPMGWVVDAYFQAQKRTHVILGLSIFRAVAVLGSIATLGAKGPAWACVAASLAFVTHALLCVVALAAMEGIPVASTLGTAGRPLLAAALMAAIVFLLDGWVPPTRGYTGFLLLAAEIALGGVAYATLCSRLARDTAEDLVRVARDVISRRWAAEPS